jgi:hypothetical protein
VLVFGGDRVPALDTPAPVSRFPPLGGGDASVVLPIPWATAEAAFSIVIGLPDTVCASQSETWVSGVATNVDSRVKGDFPFYLRASVTRATIINV